VESWKTTALILTILSVTIFLIQRSKYMFLDPAFEVCIFHVPAIISVGMYIYFKRKSFIPITKTETI